MLVDRDLCEETLVRRGLYEKAPYCRQKMSVGRIMTSYVKIKTKTFKAFYAKVLCYVEWRTC